MKKKYLYHVESKEGFTWRIFTSRKAAIKFAERCKKEYNRTYRITTFWKLSNEYGYMTDLTKEDIIV